MLDFLVVSVNHVVVSLLASGFLSCSGLLGLSVLSGGCIELFTDLLSCGHERFDALVDGFLAVALDRGFNFLDRGFSSGTVSTVDLVSKILQCLLDLGHGSVSLVTGLGEFKETMVLVLVGLGLCHHLLDLFLGQTGACLDRDRIFLAGRLVLGVNVQDAVGIDIKRHFNLRQTTGRRWIFPQG